MQKSAESIKVKDAQEDQARFISDSQWVLPAGPPPLVDNGSRTMSRNTNGSNSNADIIDDLPSFSSVMSSHMAFGRISFQDFNRDMQVSVLCWLYLALSAKD